MEDNKSEQITKSHRGLSHTLDSLSVWIVRLLSFAGIVSGIGYFVVNNNLYKYTDIQGFSVHPIQYLSAGIFPFLWGMIGLIHILINVIFSSLLVFISIIIVGLLFIFLKKQIEARLPVAFKKIFGFIGNFLNSRQATMFTKYYPIGVILFFGIYIVVSIIFGDQYSQLPRIVGGGSPSPIILVFKESNTIQHLDINVDINNPHRSQTLYLLAELTNGLLVLDPINGQVAAIREEVLIGRLDETRVDLVLLQTFIPTLRPAFISPTPSVTSTPTPTLTATMTTP